MKKLLFLFPLLQIVTLSLAQKKPLDFAAFESWQTVSGEQISDDGNYVLYTVNTGTTGVSLEVKATTGAWHKQIKNARHPRMTEDSRYVIFELPGDSLGIQELGKDKIYFIPNVVSWKVPEHGGGEWIAFKQDTQLVLRHLKKGSERKYPSVISYYFNEQGNTLLLFTASRKDSNTVMGQAKWITLPKRGETTIWSGNTTAGNAAFDLSGEQAAFIVRGDSARCGLWYYKKGMKEAVLGADDTAPGLEKGNRVADETPVFTQRGSEIMFSVHGLPVFPPDRSIPQAKDAKVHVWSFRDDIPPPGQKKRDTLYPVFRVALNTSGNKVVQLERKREFIVEPQQPVTADYVLLLDSADIKIGTHKGRSRSSYYLISIKDGTRKTVKTQLAGSGGHAQLSTAGRYVVYYDPGQKRYFSYNVASSETNDITGNLPFPIYDEADDRPNHPAPYGIAGWLEGDSAVLVYDRYDIWQLDLAGRTAPLNLTAGYGRSHNTVLRLISSGPGSPIKDRQELLLTAFELANKYNGFYRQQLGAAEGPEQLVMGPYVYHLPALSPSSRTAMPAAPLKAQRSDKFLVRRMGVSEAPNLFFTGDFRNFTPLSNIQPQVSYNWISASLVSYKQLDSATSEGILYKPENFDPGKKYPVIFYLDEKQTDGLYNFISPGFSTGPINIPYFVSNGYLVFAPDIHYKTGLLGESIYNAVISAANSLAANSWVDTSKMGIQGHDFGGYEVNFLVTRTGMFAAAMSSAGTTDLISRYGDDKYIMEMGQFRLGATLWERRDLYVNNSPVFKADKVTTPLLMVHNKKDMAVPFEQSLELFTGLRRLRKRAWMLQYDKSEHGLTHPDDKMDGTRRIQQFFDYYLKGGYPPVWMTAGVPASKKGIDSGLQPDLSGAVP